jgi:alpha-glucosidase
VSLLEDQRLGYTVDFAGRTVIEMSPLGLTVDEADLGDGVSFGQTEQYTINDNFGWRGVHADAFVNCNGAKISIIHKNSKTNYTLDVRVFNDGIAFSFIVPGRGRRVVSGEVTTFILPEGSTCWYHDFYMHYEGKHEKNSIKKIPAGQWVAPPLTYKLPDEAGYCAITEAALFNYSGMGLQADGKNGFRIRLGHEHPVSYPYELRYKDAERLKIPAAIEGRIQTPWRVVLVGADLNSLVNSDIIHSLCSPPDPELFPKGFNTPWVKPGRAVWGYLNEAPRTVEGMKEMSRLAGELGFEYHIVEGHWSRWSVEQQKDFVDYSRQRGVGVLFWKHSRDLRDPVQRQEFFQHCQNMDVAGAKIDFFDHEAKEIIDLYHDCLKEAAEYHLLLDFHGANKPTGESRTWPNELTREAIKGLESRGPWAEHNATLPFTRMLAGHADYTPMHFGARRCETSEAHQIASAIILNSSLLVFAEHPQNILNHKAVGVIKKIPPVWDKTIVLPASAIGEVAVFARKKDKKWFLAALNGPAGKLVSVDLDFLEEGDYKATFVRDQKQGAATVTMMRTRRRFGPMAGVEIDTTTVNKNRGEGMLIELLPAGGFVALFEK